MNAELFNSCKKCVVKDWCKLRSGEVKLPPDYMLSFCAAHDRLEKALELGGVPSEYRNANKFNFKFDSDNEGIRDFIVNFLERPVGFVLSGSNLALIHPNKGTGKTFTAVSVLNEFIYKTCRDNEWFDYENPVGLYVKFGTWANMLREVYVRKDDDYTYNVNKLTQQMKDVPLLVLDDIGSGRITDYIRDITYDVIDYRKEAQKATIFTSNFTEAQLRHPDMLGDMIMSRILFNTYMLSVGGRDRRAETTMRINF